MCSPSMLIYECHVLAPCVDVDGSAPILILMSCARLSSVKCSSHILMSLWCCAHGHVPISREIAAHTAICTVRAHMLIHCNTHCNMWCCAYGHVRISREIATHTATRIVRVHMLIHCNTHCNMCCCAHGHVPISREILGMNS